MIGSWVACAPSALRPRDAAARTYTEVPLGQLADPAAAQRYARTDVRTSGAYIQSVMDVLGPVIALGLSGDPRPEAYRDDTALLALGDAQGHGLLVLADPSRLGPMKGLSLKAPVTVSGRLIEDEGRSYVVVDAIEAKGDPLPAGATSWQVPGGLKIDYGANDGAGK